MNIEIRVHSPVLWVGFVPLVAECVAQARRPSANLSALSRTHSQGWKEPEHRLSASPLAFPFVARSSLCVLETRKICSQGTGIQMISHRISEKVEFQSDYSLFAKQRLSRHAFSSLTTAPVVADPGTRVMLSATRTVRRPFFPSSYDAELFSSISRTVSGRTRITTRSHIHQLI